jgi:methylmalonyl-CoA mutase
MATPPVPDAFPPVSRDDWAATVTADLGPDRYARKLRVVWEDGIVLDALHTEPGAGAGVGLAVARLVAQARQECPHSHALSVRERLDAAEATRSAVDEVLAGGADSVELDLSRVAASDIDAIVSSLAAPVLEAERSLSLHALPGTAAGRVLPTLLGRGAPIAAGVGREAVSQLASLVPRSAGSRLLRASAVGWFDAGATAGWSVALAVADGLTSLRALTAAGVEPSQAARQVELELALGADLVEGIAAVRATRIVWARGLEIVGADPTAPLQLVVTAGERILSRRDVWTNALRETAVAFAATIGGADVIRLPAFDVRRGESAPARRLARNTPLILREEAGLARVADPAGGSWHLDAATGLFAERLWAMLGELDAAGGLDAALESGLVAQRIETQRAAREAAVRTRRHALTGVSEFPDLAAPRSAPAHATSAGARFPVRADAEPFERLQDAADAGSAAIGRRHRLLLVRLGPAAESAPRAAFARGVAEVGGFDVVVSPDVTSVTQASAAFASSEAVGAILCGADTRYATDAAPVAAALKAAGLRVLFLAGRPGPDADALRAAGVDDFVFDGADIVAVLERLLAVAGVLR